MLVMQYEGECIKNMEWVELHEPCIKIKNYCYVAFINDIWLNCRNDEWEWWSMIVSASKSWNYSNHTKTIFNRKNNCPYLAVTNDIWSNQRNESYEVWRWVHKKYVMGRIIRELNPIRKKNDPKCCYQLCFIEPMKRWMRVMQYEGEWTKNTKLVE